MSRVTTSDEYVVSERVTLRVGDTFRAKGGPYYIKRDSRGGKIRMSMAARGPFRFMRFCEQGTRRWIEAIAKDGTAAVLSLTRRRSILPGALVPRPYVVVGKTGRKKRASTPAESPQVREVGPGADGVPVPQPPAAGSQGLLFSGGKPY